MKKEKKQTLHKCEETRQKAADALANIQARYVVALEVADIGEEDDGARAVQNGEAEDAREEDNGCALAEDVHGFVPEKRQEDAGGEADYEERVDDPAVGDLVASHALGPLAVKARDALALEQKEEDGPYLRQLRHGIHHRRNTPSLGQYLKKQWCLHPNARKHYPTCNFSAQNFSGVHGKKNAVFPFALPGNSENY